MRKFPALSLTAAALLSACGEPSRQAESADDFAARINGEQPALAAGNASPEPSTQPSANMSEPSPGVSPEPVSGPQTDPASVTCGKAQVASYIGREATEGVRAELAKAATTADQIRFRAPGPIVTTDNRADRLNVMLDNRNIIRDLRCQ